MATRGKRQRRLEYLDEEILINIFDYLCYADLEDAAKVSQRWNTIISTTSKLARKLWLDVEYELDPERLKKCSEKSQEFLYRNFRYDAYRRDKNPMDQTKINAFKKILNAHKNHIESFEMKNHEMRLLIDLLRETGIYENLTKLSLLTYQREDGIKASDPKFDFPNLTHLQVQNGSVSFISLIRSHNIQKLSVNETDEGFLKNEVLWKKFLGTCQNIKWLRLSKLFSFDLSSFDFKLECLLISRTEGQIEKIKKFLKSQEESLKFLEIEDCQSSLLSFVINELKVRKLHIDEITDEGDTTALKANTSIKEFRIKMMDTWFGNSESWYNEKIINSLISVEKLHIKLSTLNVFEIINFIAVSMPRLRTLTFVFQIDDCNYFSLESPEFYLKINSVEKFTIKNFFETRNMEIRKKLLTCCPNMKAFEFDFSRPVLTISELRALCSLKSLKELSLYDPDESTLKLQGKVVDVLLKSKIRKLSIFYDSDTFKIPLRLRKSRIETVCLECFEDIYQEDKFWN